MDHLQHMIYGIKYTNPGEAGKICMVWERVTERQDAGIQRGRRGGGIGRDGRAGNEGFADRQASDA